ncbi:MAG: hypothetical protein MJK04_15450 [Psychrosphaera sp.]|nr:hypothetical protein [Psychrosphaera sp.]
MQISNNPNENPFLSVESDRIDEYVEAYNEAPLGTYGIHVSKFHGYALANLDFLHQLKGLKAISIQDGYPDISALFEHHGLESLVFEALKQPLDLNLFPNISYLRGTWSAKLKNLNQAKHLAHLGLWQYKPKSTDASELANLPMLEFLELNMSNMTSLNGIDKCNNLQILKLAYIRKLSDISALANASAPIKDVHFQNCKRITDYRFLGQLQSLKVLDIEKCADIANLDFIGQSSQLEKLFFHGTTLLSGDLSPCLNHPKLNTISYNNKKCYSHKSDELHYQLRDR